VTYTRRKKEAMSAEKTRKRKNAARKKRRSKHLEKKPCRNKHNVTCELEENSVDAKTGRESLWEKEGLRPSFNRYGKDKTLGEEKEREVRTGAKKFPSNQKSHTLRGKVFRGKEQAQQQKRIG